MSTATLKFTDWSREAVRLLSTAAETVATQVAPLVAAATQARDAAVAAAQQAVDISNIDTSDDVVEGLVKGTAGAGPKTRAALSASTAAQLAAATTPPAAAADTPSAFRAIENDVITGFSTRSTARRQVGKPIDTMQSGWTPYGTAQHGNQTQTVHVSTPLGTVAQYVSNGNFSFGGIEKQNLNLDLSTQDLEVWYLLPSMAQTSKIQVYVGRPDQSNYHAMLVADSLNDPNRGVEAGVPQRAILSLQNATGFGTPPAATALRDLRFAFDATNTGNPATFQILSIGYVPKPAKAKWVPTFDDSGADLFNFVFPAMRNRGMRGTAFIDCLSTQVAGRPTVANYQAMYGLGWDIAAHAYSGASHVRYHQQTHEWRMNYLAKMKKFHADNGFPTDVFAWPLGNADGPSMRDVRRFFACARGVSEGPGYEGAVASNPMSVRTLYARRSKVLADYTTAIDKAIAAKSILPTTFHYVTPSATESDLYITEAMFTDIVSYVATKVTAGEIDVVTMSEAFLI